MQNEHWKQPFNLLKSVPPGPNRKETRRRVEISEPHYKHVSHKTRHLQNQRTYKGEYKPLKKIPKGAFNKPGNGSHRSYRPGRGHQKQAKLQKILAGLVQEI